MSEVPGSILGADVEFSFFFLVEKKFDDCENISKCRKNGTDRLRNGNVRLLYRHTKLHYSGLVALFALIFALTCRVCKIRCAHAHYLVMTL